MAIDAPAAHALVDRDQVDRLSESGSVSATSAKMPWRAFGATAAWRCNWHDAMSSAATKAPHLVMWSFFNPLLMPPPTRWSSALVIKARWSLGTSDSKLEFAIVLFRRALVYGTFSGMRESRAGPRPGPGEFREARRVSRWKYSR